MLVLSMEYNLLIKHVGKTVLSVFMLEPSRSMTNRQNYQFGKVSVFINKY